LERFISAAGKKAAMIGSRRRRKGGGANQARNWPRAKTILSGTPANHNGFLTKSSHSLPSREDIVKLLFLSRCAMERRRHGMLGCLVAQHGFDYNFKLHYLL
jgi:hypothetical protein